MGVFKQTGRKEALDEAVVHLQKAVELYPNSAVREADLALALRLAGDSEGFAQHAEAALRLDEATPHAAKKLPAELRKELRRNVSER
jgi:Flp pilus assembly protein TadD